MCSVEHIKQQKNVYIRPKPKERPRFAGKGKAYMNSKYTEWKKEFSLKFGPVMVAPPWRLSLVFRFSMPRTWPKKTKAANLGKYHRQTPDLDNLVGSVMDAIFPAKQASLSDANVVEFGVIGKFWSDVDRVDVCIEHVGVTND